MDDATSKLIDDIYNYTYFEHEKNTYLVRAKENEINTVSKDTMGDYEKRKKKRDFSHGRLDVIQHLFNSN